MATTVNFLNEGKSIEHGDKFTVFEATNHWLNHECYATKTKQNASAVQKTTTTRMEKFPSIQTQTLFEAYNSVPITPTIPSSYPNF